MKRVIIDYESYYDDTISVVTQGNANYVRDADAYIAAIAIDGEIHAGTIAELGPMMEQMVKDPTLQWWSANSNFDQAWTEKYWGPTVNPWRCILDVAGFHQLPRSLAGLAKVGLGVLVDKGARDRMRGVRYESLSVEEQEAMVRYCMNDVQVTCDLIDKYADSVSSIEEKIAEHTRLQNRRGVYIDTDLVRADKTRLEQARFDAFKRIPWNACEAPLSPTALGEWCLHNNIPIPDSVAKTDEDCTLYMSQHPALNEVINSMRFFRRANTMIKKIEALLARVTDQNILPLEMIYCGAPHTRRWASRGFNVQNLDKEPLKLTTGETVWSRNWLKPRPGHKFAIRDYAQVEPRCLQFLAGNEELMEAMRNGYSYYEAYARMARKWAGAPGTIKAEYGKVKYTLLKNECLGLGYGMGVTKFIAYAAQNGAVVSEKEAKDVVDAFRRGNPKVTSLWRRLDTLLENAKRDKEKTLQLELPSGDLMTYYTVKPTSGGTQATVIKGQFDKQSIKQHLWGGMLTENLCQRMSRDLLACASLKMEGAGFPVLFTAHDEAIDEVPVAYGEKEAEEMNQLMKQPPEWAEGLPLEVEGDYAEAYTK